MKIQLLGVGLLAATAIANAVPAHADEADYITWIADHGTAVNEHVLPIGYQICADTASHGTAGLDHQAELAAIAGVPSHDAAVFIVGAIVELCPSNLPALNAWLATDNT